MPRAGNVVGRISIVPDVHKSQLELQRKVVFLSSSILDKQSCNMLWQWKLTSFNEVLLASASYYLEGIGGSSLQSLGFH